MEPVPKSEIVKLVIGPYKELPLDANKTTEELARIMIASFMFNMTSISIIERGDYMKNTKPNLNTKLVEGVANEIKLIMLNKII